MQARAANTSLRRVVRVWVAVQESHATCEKLGYNYPHKEALMRTRAFTLIELLVVIAIIAILAAIGAVVYANRVDTVYKNKQD